jgi:hypothetical protein
MNKIFSALVACIVTFSVFTGFAPQASAQNKHVYLNLESVACPNVSAGGYIKYAFSWKSEDEIPSIPEANEYKRFFPNKQGEGDCYGKIKIINVNQKYQFPVDRNILLQPAVDNGGTPLQPFVIPATQNLEGTETTFTDKNGYKSTIKYKVTFE